jgi:hypothetical protein
MCQEIDRLLISTFRRVFVREPDGHEVLVLDKCSPFYGLTWSEDHLFVGARCWGATGHDNLFIYDRDFELLEQQSLPTSNQQIHQILYHKGIVYILDTPYDKVLAWDPVTLRGEVVVDMDGYDPQDIYHFNSLWWHDNEFWLVGLHGDLWTFSESWDQQGHRSFDSQLHNVYREDGKLFLGASSLESLMIEDGDGQRFISLTEYVGESCYARGIARGRYLYVGAALLRGREERTDGGSYIIVFDGETPIKSIGLEGTGGLHGVRVLGLDKAHNDIPW